MDMVRNFTRTPTLAIALLALALLFASYANAGPAQERQEVSQAKAAVVATLKDPASAQFRNVSYIADTAAVCGQFNAKNGYGGYANFDDFAYKEGNLYTLNRLDTESDSDWSKLEAAAQKIKSLCHIGK